MEQLNPLAAADSAPETPSELQVLKQRADMLGVPYSNNIGVETLRQRVADAMEGKKAEPEQVKSANPLGADIPEVETPMQLRARLMAEQLKLVRLRITNMDPKKKDLPGEILTVANEYIGTVRKYIPYGEQTDNGYHVPYCLYTLLESRRFQHIRVTKKNGREHVETSWAKEFSLEILPQLTPDELAKLAASQAAAGGLSTD